MDARVIQEKSALQQSRQAWLYGGLGMTGFSLTLPMTRLAITVIDPLLVGLGRALVAAALAFVALYVTRQKIPRLRYWWRFALVGGGVVIGFPLLSSLAMNHVPADAWRGDHRSGANCHGACRDSTRWRTPLRWVLVFINRVLCAGVGLCLPSGGRPSTICRYRNDRSRVFRRNWLRRRRIARAHFWTLAGDLLGVAVVSTGYRCDHRVLVFDFYAADFYSGIFCGNIGGLGCIYLRQCDQHVCSIYALVSRVGDWRHRGGWAVTIFAALSDHPCRHTDIW